MEKLEIILAQFGERCSVVNPSFSSFRNYFPNAKFTLYCDRKISISGIETKVVKSICDEKHPRYGNRNNDYFKIFGLLKSEHEMSIAIDNDMCIVSNNILKIVDLTKKFGLCIPCNPRYLVHKDTMIGEDSDRIIDDSGGTGFALNMSPISFYKSNEQGRKILDEYCNNMLQKNMRGPLVMWRSIWKIGFNPYLLPPQWCVCLEHCGVGDEIILHLGHEKVKKFYNK